MVPLLSVLQTSSSFLQEKENAMYKYDHMYKSLIIPSVPTDQQVDLDIYPLSKIH